MPKFIPPEIVNNLVQTADIIEVIGNRVDLTKDKKGKEVAVQSVKEGAHILYRDFSVEAR